MSPFHKRRLPETKTELAWLDKHGGIHRMSLSVLPPVRTAVEWQQVFEYTVGFATWIESK